LGDLGAFPVGVDRPSLAVLKVIEEFAISGRSHVPGPDDVRSVDIGFVVNPLKARRRNLAVADENKMFAREAIQISEDFGPVRAYGQ
jgi:hypothetical protein